jgi:phosphatidate cytidylyltransferase
MARVLSAAVLLPIVLGAIWFSQWATLAIGVVAAALAFVEYAAIAAKLDAHVPRIVAGLATVAATIALARPWAPIVPVLLTASVAVGALAVAAGRPSAAVLRDSAAALFPVLYIGLPIGVIVSLRGRSVPGRGVLLLLLATIVASDTTQYYVGRLAGKRPLAPAISPKKTREGAIGGVVAGAVVALVLGVWWLPWVAPVTRLLLGATVATSGIVGDLFESLLKRSADVKDSSTLIPGHGGVLDRIDSWLFAGPVYYVFLLYASDL